MKLEKGKSMKRLVWRSRGRGLARLVRVPKATEAAMVADRAQARAQALAQVLVLVLSLVLAPILVPALALAAWVVAP